MPSITNQLGGRPRNMIVQLDRNDVSNSDSENSSMHNQQMAFSMPNAIPNRSRLTNNNSNRDDEIEMLASLAMIDEMMMNRIINTLINGGNNHERVDVYDPEAAKKASALNLPETGLLPHQIDAIFPITYKKGMIKSDDPSKLECNICLVEF